MKNEKIRKAVRDSYGRIAVGKATECGPTNSCSCCGGVTPDTVSKAIGYSDGELKAVPEGADLGLGCGNPTAMASLKEGEVVLDLGSGAGLDCFLAADKVGKTGRVIGVDMTAEMIEKARENARKGDYRNVEFRLGEIENLPAADNSVDVVISNCVINLSPDKRRVFDEAYRVLRPGGRVMVSDIALLKELPAKVRKSMPAYVGCVGGASIKEEYLATIEAAGFKDVDVVKEVSARGTYGSPSLRDWAANLGTSSETIREVVGSIVSMQVWAIKPN
jgi:SAM-dependent methyltransferase